MSGGGAFCSSVWTGGSKKLFPHGIILTLRSTEQSGKNWSGEMGQARLPLSLPVLYSGLGKTGIMRIFSWKGITNVSSLGDRL